MNRKTKKQPKGKKKSYIDAETYTFTVTGIPLKHKFTNYNI